MAAGTTICLHPMMKPDMPKCPQCGATNPNYDNLDKMVKK